MKTSTKVLMLLALCLIPLAAYAAFGHVSHSVAFRVKGDICQQMPGSHKHPCTWVSVEKTFLVFDDGSVVLK